MGENEIQDDNIQNDDSENMTKEINTKGKKCPWKFFTEPKKFRIQECSNDPWTCF